MMGYFVQCNGIFRTNQLEQGEEVVGLQDPLTVALASSSGQLDITSRHIGGGLMKLFGHGSESVLLSTRKNINSFD
jgi:hypothetical protein